MAFLLWAKKKLTHDCSERLHNQNREVSARWRWCWSILQHVFDFHLNRQHRKAKFVDVVVAHSNLRLAQRGPVEAGYQELLETAH